MTASAKKHVLIAMDETGNSGRGFSDDQINNPENPIAQTAMNTSNPSVSAIALRAACCGVMRIFPSEMPTEYNSEAAARPHSDLRIQP